MEFLGVGPLELLVIVVIALLVLGPRDLAKTARSAGRFLNRMYHSEAWKTVNQASRDLRDLPNRLAREAALEELDEAIKSGNTAPQISTEGVNPGLEPGLEAWRPSPKGEPSQPRSDQAFGPTPGGVPRPESTPSGTMREAGPSQEDSEPSDAADEAANDRP
jgi:sec-independent protein translocase protein TatB